jgi:hypothetical protein
MLLSTDDRLCSWLRGATLHGQTTKEPIMSTTAHDTSITIRLATEADEPALRRLAQLDGARLPEGQLLIAEAGGELRAALRITDRAYVADPFYPSRELVALLDVRARRLRQEHFTAAERVRTRVGLWGALWFRQARTRPIL